MPGAGGVHWGQSILLKDVHTDVLFAAHGLWEARNLG